MKDRHALPRAGAPGLLRRLVRDRAGNTLAIIAAAIAPIMAMVGGGVDMGRSYLSQSRLQQACDAGVLAARKRLGSEAAVTGTIPDDAAEVGQRFFNINFRNGSYGSEHRDFVMTLEEDFAISAVATVDVPTTIMGVFGFEKIPVRVACEAQLNVANTDVMMVLDVTGSMRETNPGDSVTRLAALKSTVRSFYDQMAAAAMPGTRVRYGFVPYSTNVNVGSLLKDEWVVDEWTYQSRRRIVDQTTVTTRTYNTNWTNVSGSASTVVHQTYPATYHPPSSETGSGGYSCDIAPPPNSSTTSTQLISTTTEPVVGPPPGVRIVKHYRRVINGVTYSVSRSGTTCTIRKTTYSSYVQEYDQITEPTFRTTYRWLYRPITLDVSDWRTASNGCIEERSTYEIGDYDNVDLSRALDLDIDLVPSAGDEETQWRPMYPGIVYARAMRWNGTGAFSKTPVTTTEDYVNPGSGGFASCPPRARKLAVMTSGQVDSYLGTLSAAGSTYHDIGMIWGGRLLSPTGIFASENADVDVSRPTSRHLIFLTDGTTDALDISYSSYGVEPLDERRWTSGSSLTLNQVVEKRFAVACSEVKKRNITVWVIGFGTTLNPVMTECAGEGRYFVAADADELNAIFASIAKRLGELRISR